MTTNNKHPRSLTLTQVEQEELRALVSCQSSSMAFWLRAYGTRGIAFLSKLPKASPTTIDGEFRLEWTGRALGPSAIALGAQYRRFQEEKEQKFEDRMQRTGRGVW